MIHLKTSDRLIPEQRLSFAVLKQEIDLAKKGDKEALDYVTRHTRDLYYHVSNINMDLKTFDKWVKAEFEGSMPEFRIARD